VRAFLLAGFMALFVDIFAQIWYAAVDQGKTWIWWVCGIILGVLILAMFAVFEKRRNEMLKMLDDMKRWN
jgi:4-amino-4-deoxy-L-arabinose transferase-like glycosyltransferase